MRVRAVFEAQSGSSIQTKMKSWEDRHIHTSLRSAEYSEMGVVWLQQDLHGPMAAHDIRIKNHVKLVFGACAIHPSNTALAGCQLQKGNPAHSV